MNRRNFLGMTVVGAAAGTALATPAIAQQTFRWRMATLYPRGVSFGVAYDAFAKRVESASGGRLVIDVVYDGEGVGATEVFAAAKSGLVEMGSPYMALHAGEMPSGVVELGLPGGPERYDQLYTLFSMGGWAPVLDEAYGSQGLVHLGPCIQPGVYVLTKEPINALSDLKGMKLRSPGAYGNQMRQLGVAPVTMAFSEVYTSLATGVIDGCASSNLIDYRDGKWYEQAKYLYPVPLSGAQVAPTIVNRRLSNLCRRTFSRCFKSHRSNIVSGMSGSRSRQWPARSLKWRPLAPPSPNRPLMQIGRNGKRRQLRCGKSMRKPIRFRRN